MNSTLSQKIETQRQLCIKKDLNELNLWISTLEELNNELNYFNVIEKQLVKKGSVSNSIQGLRRKNVLIMATFCKYDQALKNEYEYGKTEYNALRANIHENKRAQYVQLVKEFNTLKKHIYQILIKYHRK